MKRRSSIVALAIAVAIAAVMSAPASAQSCLGYTPFSVAPLRASGDLSFVNSRTIYGASIVGGQARPGVFGGGAVSGERTGGANQTTRTLGLSGGFSVPLTAAASTVELCPVATLDHVWYPDFAGENVSGNNFTIGGAMGRSIVASPTLDIVPFGDLRFVRRSFSRATDHFANKSGQLALGAGVVFSKTLTLRPELVIPSNGASNLFAISVGYNFGK